MSRGFNDRRMRKWRREQAAAQAPGRHPTLLRRLALTLPVLAISATLAATALVGIGVGDGSGRKQAGGHVTALLAGIPQDGITLGSPDAPITLEVYADLECPTVRLFVENYLPSIIDTWVRPGALKLNYHSLKTDTANEHTFFRQEVAAMAAGKQDKLWNFALTFVHNQGSAFTDYATDDFLAGIAAQVPDLKKGQWADDRKDALLMKRVALDVHFAHTKNIISTPSFLTRYEGSADDEDFRSSITEDVEDLRAESLDDVPRIGELNSNQSE